MNRLAGKVALITGAASGIGESIARAFASEGGLVFVSDLRDEPGESVAGSLGPPARYVHLDVREEKQWAAVVDSIVKDHGRLDVVVNNAGITGFEGASDGRGIRGKQGSRANLHTSCGDLDADVGAHARCG